MDLEIMATSALKRSIAETELLSPFINEKDREPSWDGNIYIYSDCKKTKENLKRVPVQVKGKKSETLPYGTIKYRIEVNDLKNYLSDGGVLYFVVYINKRGDTRIYYASLLPVRLKMILEESDNDSVAVEFKEFPEDEFRKTTILMTFYDNMKKQTSFSNAKLLSMEDLALKDNIENLTLTVKGYGKKDIDPLEILFQNEGDLYWYAKLNEETIPQPLADIPINMYMLANINFETTINGVKYYDSFQRTDGKDKVEIEIGNSLRLTFWKNSDKVSVKVIPPTNLKYAVHDLEFLLALADANEIEVNGVKLSLSEIQLFTHERIETLTKQLEYFKKVEAVFDLLKIKKDCDLKDLSKYDQWWTSAFVKGLVDKEPICIKQEIASLTKVDYLGMKILLCFGKVIDAENMYKLYTLAEAPFGLYYSDDNDVRKFITWYDILKPSDFLEISNIDYEEIIHAYKLYDEGYIYSQATLTLLNIIHAYDQSDDIRKDVLQGAEKVGRWLIDDERISEDDVPLSVRQINVLQIIKRERQLSRSEQQIAFGIAENELEHNDIRVAAYLLLDNQLSAEKYYEMLSENEKRLFKTYPIFRFWQKSPQS